MVDKSNEFEDKQLLDGQLADAQSTHSQQAETETVSEVSAETDNHETADEAYDAGIASQAVGLNSNVPVVKLEDEIKQSFIDYAMSVIVDRALPDVRDGLKPVHRRVLFDMYDLKIWHNGPTKKSARVVGDVIGRFHPHGDAAVYDTIVRMAQWFSMRAPLIYGQGNFGNLDGDGAAAMRYTEVRMTKIAEMMLQDIDKETVNTYPNYDGNEQIPEVLPTRYPNLLVNGSSGIAVGLATNIPPHNLAEVIDGTIALLKNPNLTLDEIMQYIPGPDFPTGGLIVHSSGIKQAYATGKGRCIIRARTHVETDKQGRKTIYVDEIPYMVNKSTIVKEIATLVREKKIEGIAEINDLSDKDNQVRIAIDLKRDAYEEAVLNNLFEHTSMQSSFAFNVIALVNNRPKQLSLLEILQEFIKFRREVVTRRTVYLLRQDRRKAFINEGLIAAKSNIQRIIDLVTNAANPEDARNKLMNEAWDGSMLSGLIEKDEEGVNICLPIGIDPHCGLKDGKYYLSDAQARAILALQLNRLTHLAADEILADYKALQSNIKGYLEILNSTERMNEVIHQELLEAKNTFHDKRRSSFVYVDGFFSKADLIARQDVLITLSHQGYIKYQDLSYFEAQNRGTKGNSAAKLKDEDFIETSTVCSSHDMLLCFTNFGRCFVAKVYDLPTSNNRTWRGRPIQNMFELQENELVKRLLPLSEDMLAKLEAGELEDTCIVFATVKGDIKRTRLSEFRTQIKRANGQGIKAITMKSGDELVAVEFSSGSDDILLFSSNGRCMRFCEYYSKGDDDSADTDNDISVDSDNAAEVLDADIENGSDGESNADTENGAEDEVAEESEAVKAERIASELSALQRYLSIRKNGSGIRPKGRSSGTNRGIRLAKGAKLAAMIIVPDSEVASPEINYIMITDKGTGKRGRIISLMGKLNRGGQGIACCSRTARAEENVVSVIKAHEDSDYLVFSDNGSIMRSHTADISCRSRVAGFIKVKAANENEHIVGLQEIDEDVVKVIDEMAEARAAEKKAQSGTASVSGTASIVDASMMNVSSSVLENGFVTEPTATGNDLDMDLSETKTAEDVDDL